MPDAEFLTADEVAEVTGYKHSASQKDWLAKHGWKYVVNAAGKPIISRLYARMRMSGVTPTAAGIAAVAWTPDFSSLG